MAVKHTDLCIQRHFYTSSSPWKWEWSKAAVLVVLSGGEDGEAAWFLQVELCFQTTEKDQKQSCRCSCSSCWLPLSRSNYRSVPFLPCDVLFWQMDSGLWWVGALNGERKPFQRKTSNISGKMWCTHLGSGNEDKQHKDAAERRWLHQGTCSSHCSSPLLSVARENGVGIMLTAVTGWFGTWYLLFRRCQHLVSDHGHAGWHELFCWGLWWHILLSLPFYTC